jgi:hypothetical protein
MTARITVMTAKTMKAAHMFPKVIFKSILA